jgi:two-component system, LytTR family, response regulator LytT
MKVKCLIVEDEPIAQEILRSYIDKTDFLSVEGQLGNAIEAFNFLQRNTVNLLFLDIKMPQMSGIDLLKAITHKPSVIITSAYRYYATDAFDLDVIDYLLKPYSFERFLKAVGKVMMTEVTSGNAMASSPAATGEKAYIFVKGNKQLQKVYLDEILYIESQRDYLKFRTAAHADIVTRQTIGYYERFLPAQQFLRVHRSFIVAAHKISAVEANRIFIGAIPIPVGRNYKDHVQEYLKNL